MEDGMRRSWVGVSLGVVFIACGPTAEQAQEAQRLARARARQKQGSVRIITHPTHPNLLYVTTLPDAPRPWLDQQPTVYRLAMVDLATGQWRELDLEDVQRRFGLERPNMSFEVRSPNDVAITRE
jgi:hypothetical protein